jgi:hypothetical protein
MTTPALEADAHEAGASVSSVGGHRCEDRYGLTSENVPPAQARFAARRQLRTTSLMQPIGPWPRKAVDANSMKDMVGPFGLVPQASTVSSCLVFVRVQMNRAISTCTE